MNHFVNEADNVKLFLQAIEKGNFNSALAALDKAYFRISQTNGACEQYNIAKGENTGIAALKLLWR